MSGYKANAYENNLNLRIQILNEMLSDPNKTFKEVALKYDKGEYFVYDGVKKINLKIKRGKEILPSEKKLVDTYYQYKNHKDNNTFRNILKEKQFIREQDWSHGWLKTPDGSIFIKNKNDEEEYIEKEDFEEIITNTVTKFLKDKTFEYKQSKTFGNFAFRAVKTDEHVGLEPNPDGKSLYGFKYNAEIYQNSIDEIYQKLVTLNKIYGTAEVTFVDSLGDGVDGWNGFTTRGGHQLSQNMDNETMFDVYVKTNLKLIQSLVEANISKKVVFRYVTNCNHGGDFGLLAAKTIKTAVELMYPNSVAEVIILKRFIEHFFYGNHCHIMTHGKDKKEMKFPLPLQLNDKAVDKIRDYIDYHKIDSKYIHFDKGDLHQVGYDKRFKFDYRNYMSFAPPSNYVQTNFGPSYHGFSTQLIPKWSNNIQHTDHFFEFEKNDR